MLYIFTRCKDNTPAPREVSKPIDTATCAIADRAAYVPLDVEEVGYQVAGVSAHLCFSNTANADGRCPAFVQAEDGQVIGVYVEFVPLAEMIG